MIEHDKEGDRVRLHGEPKRDVLPTCQSDLDTVLRYLNIVKGGNLAPTETHYIDNAINLVLRVRSNMEDI